MVVFPNAKINIGLDILRRRPDGYHDICTAMIPVPWRDVLEIVTSENDDTTLHTSGRAVDCPPEKNLVMKAYRSVARDFALPPLDIYLHKVIPDGAGLGGGSADAAFTITALNAMFNLGLSHEQMSAMAAGIGADCPFFIYNRPMLASGIGEILTPIDINLDNVTVAIIKPPLSISTAEAYSATHPHEPASPLSQAFSSPRELWHERAVNAFEKPLCNSYPIIAEVKAALYDAGAFYASLSGSGSAVFGLFENDILSESLRAQFPQCDIFCSPLR